LKEAKMVEVKVHGMGRCLSANWWLLLLKEERTSRYLPVAISLADAHAIALRLAKTKLQRPLTHNLIQSLIEKLGGKISCVCIDHVLSDGRLCAQVIVTIRGRRLCVDCRPSDAIALALQASVPIYVEEAVMAEKGTVLQNQHQRVSPEEKKKLAPFAEFVNGLDLDGL
jgi:bifunctional DNase/RNase